MGELTMLTLPIGLDATVRAIDAQSRLKARLTDLGLTPGAPVRCLFAAPAGEPRAYLVRETVLALRAGDAAGVYVAPAGGKEDAWV